MTAQDLADKFEAFLCGSWPKEFKEKIQECVKQWFSDNVTIPNASDKTPTQIGLKPSTGASGVDMELSRSDHSHETVYLANPGDPTITVSGLTLIGAVAILDRRPGFYEYGYSVSARVSQTAGNGWGFLNTPFKPGFQQPKITGIGNYRNGSTTPQDDDVSGTGGTGAAPRGPYMGKEYHHYRSTRRIYSGFFRRDNDITSNFVDFDVDYKCTNP